MNEQSRREFEALVLSTIGDRYEQRDLATYHNRDGERYVNEDLNRMYAVVQAARASAEPIPMLLFCPQCRMQHIDAPESDYEYVENVAIAEFESWSNPPHRTHLCHSCGHTWRPADVATTGVAELKTRGQNDGSPVPVATAKECLTVGEPVAWQVRSKRDGLSGFCAWEQCTPELAAEVAQTGTYYARQAESRALYAKPPATTEEPSAVGKPVAAQFPREFDGAFVTSINYGRAKRYELVFKFPNIHTMQAAHNAWVLRDTAHHDARDAERAQEDADMIAVLRHDLAEHRSVLARANRLLALYTEFYDTVADCFGDTHGVDAPRDGDPWWHETNAAYGTRDVVAAIETQDRARLDAKVAADEREYLDMKAKEKAERAAIDAAMGGPKS